MSTSLLSAVCRPLSDEEVQQLEATGCRAEDWSNVEVATNFDPLALGDVTISGRVRLGAFHGTVLLPGGVERPRGIRRAVLHNCEIGHNVLIENIGRHIANYRIGDGAVIQNVDLLAVEGETAFGNGTRVNVLHEAGGREATLFDRLSAQIAYLLAVYRDRPEMRRRLEAMIERHVASVRRGMGTIGAGAWIVGCGAITNVRIGPAARVCGAAKLAEGSIHSSTEAPTKIGEGVIAEHFIVADGAVVDSGTILTHSFVGQGARIARRFSADHSLFFANSEALHGEACCALSGPFTVTHHKSSLLIAGMCSFFNAGSGTNQSNHMYKLGPVHQGILERGCKTGSDSYLLWPARVGAFTVVIGRHKRNFDTSAFPFSYLLEQEGESVLVPGANLFTVGTRRDLAKWPQRDRRHMADRLDLVHFDALNPCTVGKMLEGRRLLCELEAADDANEFVTIHGVKIPRPRLPKAISAYTTAIQWYLGSRIAAGLERLASTTAPAQWVAELRKLPPPQTQADGAGPWIDVCGLLAPASVLERLMSRVADGQITDLGELESELRQAYRNYAAWEWNWVLDTWLRELDKSPQDVSLADLALAIEGWRDASQHWTTWVLRDAEQEFRAPARIGYGLEGDAAAGEADFRAVRGSIEQNKFLAAIKQEMAEVSQRAETLLEVVFQAAG
jgi:hypothetical protein